MNELKERFEAVQCSLMDLIDTINDQHKGGVDFGTGHRLYPAEIHTIEAIGDSPEITVTRLAERMGVSKPTISERINKLSRKGLVSKGTKAGDAKAVPLCLTESGNAAYKGHADHHQQMFDLFVGKYGDDAEAVLRKFSFAFKEMRELAVEFSCKKG
ncbi:MarR family winged helix-turn-helix transcriptional regulator [Maridesulfovibrio sp.]|uniref:MarR family winged helix-turn-helix transcriptional regulator n=1 Tax=Maridesulfovibrio sp. TaxID=2795000 RepID=UPI002A1873F2|nr:MarR family winged helix-turn-helix transcriptional regulator [Maridesulfovibrio sp.]